jgi:oligopeptide transport system substrate-binding protein
LEEQTYNPDIAKQKLAQAGYAGGKGLPQITLSYRSDARTKTRAEAIQNIYQQSLGININLEPVEAKELVARRKKNETYPQMVMAGWCQDYPDPQDWYSTVFNSAGTVEHNGWKSAQFDQLTDQGDIQQDPGIRRELYRQAAQVLLTETPVFMMYWAVVWELVNPRVQGFVVDPLENFIGERSLYTLRLTS